MYLIWVYKSRAYVLRTIIISYLYCKQKIILIYRLRKLTEKEQDKLYVYERDIE